MSAVSDMKFYDPAHAFERSFWGDCANTIGEELKHYVYARLMGIEAQGVSFNVRGKTVLDIGGGPVSMLLKSKNLAAGKVCDPINYPEWIYRRYDAKGLTYAIANGEDMDETGWDEVWIYNVLQHCLDPEKVIANALNAGKILRLFEWIDFPPHPGHPQMLTEANLTKWLGAPGYVNQLSESGCIGKSFSGIFKK